MKNFNFKEGLFCPRPQALSVFSLLFFLAMFTPGFVVAQPGGPGAQWTSGVNFESNGTASEDAWAFDAAEMPNGDMVLVGYTETENGTLRVPAYSVVNKYGELLASQYFPGIKGGLSQVKRSDDGTYLILAGYRGLDNDDDPTDPNAPQNADALLVKLLYENQTYSVGWTTQYAVGKGIAVNADATITGQEGFGSVDIAPDGKIVVTGGFRKGNTGNFEFGYQFVKVINADGTEGSPPNERIFTNANGVLADCKVVNIAGENCIIFTGFKQMGHSGWKFEITDEALNSDAFSLQNTKHAIVDRDIVIGKLSLNNLQNGFVKYFDGKDYPYGQAWEDPSIPGASSYTGNTGVSSNANIWDDPDIDECPNKFGPCTPGKSVPGWGFASDHSKNGSPAIDAYLSSNSCDVGKSLVYKNGYIYVAAEVNILEFSAGQYNLMQHSDDRPGITIGRGVLLKNRCNGEDKWFPAYKDASIHLIRIKADGTAGIMVKNVAHFSGGDFSPAIVIDQTDGNIVLGGNSSDDGVGGCFPEMDDCHNEENMLLKLDIDNFDILWQQTHLVNGEGNCNFGLIQTADGGFALIGNNELEGNNETFNIVRFTADCQGTAGFDQDGDHIVTSVDEQWSPANKPNPYRFRGNVIIPNGRKLTIKGGLVVEFASTKNTPDHRKSGITVQAGGKLYVGETSVLKGVDCGGEQMWDGITVLGNPSSPAGAQQGYVSLSGNSRIENAVRGVVLGNTNWDIVTREMADGNAIGTTITDTYMDNLGMGGGKISTFTATFRNCGRGVVWEPHQGFSNMSNLLFTKFEFSGPLADPLYAFMPDWPSTGRPTGAELGCRLRSVREVTFVNCSFISTEPSGFYQYPRNRPSGIYATNAKFSFTGGNYPQHFKDLHIGAESASTLAGLATSLSFKDAKMDNVYQGLNVRGNITPDINGCHFLNIPDMVDPKFDGTPAGTFTVSTQGIALSSNNFSSNASYKSYGAIVINSLGTGGASVESNTFTDMNIANFFDKDNASLQTHCNTYQGDVGDVSWNVKGLLANQGSPFPNIPKPDNKFLWECEMPLLDIRNTNAQPFSYFERLESAANTNTIVKCVDNVLVFYDGSDLGAANCVFQYRCPNPPNCTTLMGLYTSTGKSLPYRNELLSAYVRMSPTVVADSLYLPGTTRAITLLADRNQQADKRILAATYASLGNYNAAQQYLQQVTGADTESQDFIQYYTVLINAGLAGRDDYHLTNAEFAQLAPLMTHNSTVAENVKVLDHILNGVYHPLEAEPSTGSRPSERAEEGKDALMIDGLRVLPNPFDSELTFFSPEGTMITALSIFDISGKAVYSHKFGNAQSMVLLNTASMSQGVLFYQCQLSDGKTLRGKIIHHSKK